MPRLSHAVLAAMLLAVSLPLHSQDSKPIPYPETRRQDLVETQFGERIADPYRWLENDVRNDTEVADWVARQNRVTRAYLERIAPMPLNQRALAHPGAARA